MLQDDSVVLLSRLELLAQQVQASLAEYRQDSPKFAHQQPDLVDSLQDREKELLAVLGVAQEFIVKAGANAAEIERLKAEIDKNQKSEAELRDEVDGLKVKTRQHSLSTVNEGYAKLSTALMHSEKALTKLEQLKIEEVNPPLSPLSPLEIETVENTPKSDSMLHRANFLARDIYTEEVDRLKRKLSTSKLCAKDAENKKHQAEEQAKALEHTVVSLKRQVTQLTSQVEQLTEEAEAQATRALDSELKTSNLIERLSGLEE